MKIRECFSQKGFFVLEAVCTKTNNVVFRKPFKNQLTSINRNYRQAMLDGTFASKNFNIGDLQIKYIGLGDGTTPATENDTRLANERFRKVLTTINSIGENTQAVFALLPSEGNFGIREIAIFSGPNATSIPNSGNMIARVVLPQVFNKNPNIRLNIYRIDRTVI